MHLNIRIRIFQSSLGAYSWLSVLNVITLSGGDNIIELISRIMLIGEDSVLEVALHGGGVGDADVVSVVKGGLLWVHWTPSFIGKISPVTVIIGLLTGSLLGLHSKLEEELLFLWKLDIILKLESIGPRDESES